MFHKKFHVNWLNVCIIQKPIDRPRIWKEKRRSFLLFIRLCLNGFFIVLFRFAEISKWFAWFVNQFPKKMSSSLHALTFTHWTIISIATVDFTKHQRTVIFSTGSLKKKTRFVWSSYNLLLEWDFTLKPSERNKSFLFKVIFGEKKKMNSQY